MERRDEDHLRAGALLTAESVSSPLNFCKSFSESSSWGKEGGCLKGARSLARRLQPQSLLVSASIWCSFEGRWPVWASRRGSLAEDLFFLVGAELAHGAIRRGKREA
jgi:hypothetical protein